MAGRKPLIGITGPESGAAAPRFCISMALRMAGGRVQQLRPGADPDIADFDGMVISGGHDIEPVLYKSAAEVEGNYDPERDKFESDVIDMMLSAGKPLLGICRGAQLLNVCRGGNLHQNLQELHPNTPRRRTILPVKKLSIDDSSRLAQILGRSEVSINSLHNQSIDELGADLTVTARDARDVVQAIEDPEHRWLIGVQWHPEYLLYQRASMRLFRSLVDTALQAQGHT